MEHMVTVIHFEIFSILNKGHYSHTLHLPMKNINKKLS
ncbi:hypothetical protein PU02_1049 [Bartonella ancashensis]|uniref:Uncharacterized protein n=1 Tax=Bartonella ancashensis TaxID=1318743 RepID=A0A0M4L8P2_9HYPH|nr:hypothetical protein PU02_1049 [Bartonella ancashensis]